MSLFESTPATDKRLFPNTGIEVNKKKEFWLIGKHSFNGTDGFPPLEPGFGKVDPVIRSGDPIR